MAYHHPSRSCRPCHIYGTHQHHYDHIEAFDVEKSDSVLQLYISNIPGDSCMCRALQLEAISVTQMTQNMFLHGKREPHVQLYLPETSLTGTIIVPSPERIGLFYQVYKWKDYVRHIITQCTAAYTPQSHVLVVGQNPKLGRMHLQAQPCRHYQQFSSK